MVTLEVLLHHGSLGAVFCETANIGFHPIRSYIEDDDPVVDQRVMIVGSVDGVVLCFWLILHERNLWNGVDVLFYMDHVLDSEDQNYVLVAQIAGLKYFQFHFSRWTRCCLRYFQVKIAGMPRLVVFSQRLQ